MAEVHGECDARFSAVRDALAASLDNDDVGASAAVFIDGEPVVDVWGGYADKARTTPWERGTIVNVWSTTKTMTNLCALVLADRGEIDLYAPVARYWPEFGAAGKESVAVRHLLSHTAGLPGWDTPLKSPEEFYDWARCTDLLAKQAPWWEPGTASGYHAVTQGYLVGEVIRRVTGQSAGTFFAQEIAGPLHADFYIGLPATDDARVSNVFVSEPTKFPEDPDQTALKILGDPPLLADPEETVATRQWRAAEIPAGNGHGNARSVAAVQSVLACGGQARGVKLMSEQGCNAVFDQQSDGPDLVMGIPVRFGMGYALASRDLSPNPRACYWGGAGGSLVLVDLDARMVISYVMNHMLAGNDLNTTGDGRALNIVQAAYTALNVGGRW
jgi:CubicO group peptidase (beta-lactamase class C family)